MTKNNLIEIQEKIGYYFNETYLLVQAFVRKSFAAENQNWEDNEKLEFVGDKVLDFIVVKKLTFHFGLRAETIAQSLESIQKGEKGSANNCTDAVNFEFLYSEGEMSEIKKQLVQTSFLARAIERLELQRYLLMSKGDIKNNVQEEDHVKEDLLEAIIGAVAIDSSWDMGAIEKVIDRMLDLDYYIKNGVDDGIDYITYIQNWHQKEYGNDPNYSFYDVNNEDVFMCDLFFEGFGISFEGFGNSKKKAMRIAAKRAYNFLQETQKKCDSIVKIVGEFNINNSVSKLQELQDKKHISGVKYIFREEQTTKNNGNPIWYCQCTVNGIDNFVESGHAKKAEAKRIAAFCMLRILTTGRNITYDEFITKGEKDNDEQ